MAIPASYTIKKNSTLPPDIEQDRVNKIIKDRRLYNGNFGEMGVDAVNSRIPALNTNWFRRVSLFFPEFMLADRPEVIIDGNERYTELLENMEANIFLNLQESNRCMLAYGEGIIASHPMNPLEFVYFEPDLHYEVVDENGVIVGDILIRDRRTSVTENGEVDVITYMIDGKNKWQVFSAPATGNLGELKRTVPMPKRMGRQVVSLTANAAKRSIFDDMKPFIGEMSRVITTLSRTILRNGRPHLVVPENTLKVNDNGTVEVDVEGMVLFVQSGDNDPMYLQWDPNIEAVQWQFENSEKSMMAMAALSPLLFDPEMSIGSTTGTALKRLMIPFYARLQHLSRVNETAIEEMLQMNNLNRSVNGEEVFSFEPRDIEVVWGYDELFADEVIEQAQEQPVQDEQDDGQTTEEE